MMDLGEESSHLRLTDGLGRIRLPIGVKLLGLVRYNYYYHDKDNPKR